MVIVLVNESYFRSDVCSGAVDSSAAPSFRRGRVVYRGGINFGNQAAQVSRRPTTACTRPRISLAFIVNLGVFAVASPAGDAGRYVASRSET